MAAPDRQTSAGNLFLFFLRKNIILNWHWMCCEGEKGLTWTEECMCWREQVGFMLVNNLHLTSITVMGRRWRHYKSRHSPGHRRTKNYLFEQQNEIKVSSWVEMKLIISGRLTVTNQPGSTSTGHRHGCHNMNDTATGHKETRTIYTREQRNTGVYNQWQD